MVLKRTVLHKSLFYMLINQSRSRLVFQKVHNAQFVRVIYCENFQIGALKFQNSRFSQLKVSISQDR